MKFTNTNDLARVFVVSAAIMLAITGVAKIVSSFGTAQILAVIDPLIGISFRNLMRLDGLLECVIATICLLTPKRRYSIILITWLATMFLVYRLGLVMVGYHKPCPCLGSLSDVIHLSTGSANIIMKCLLAYLLVAGYLVLALRWSEQRK